MKLLLYCCKNPHKLYATNEGYVITDFELGDYYKNKEKLNGKIVAECDFEVEKIRIVDDDPLGAYWYETKTLSENEVLEKSCLTGDELFDYLGEDNEGYAIHIKNLYIFNEPKELREYGTWVQPLFLNEGELALKRLEKAPQNMMKCYDFEKDYILISIRPEWLCKILNGEKTAEIRKKVLKEMLK